MAVVFARCMVIVLMGGTWFFSLWAHAAQLSVTEYRHRFSPKYFGLELHRVEEFLPHYIESLTAQGSFQEYFIDSATRHSGVIHWAMKKLRKVYLNKGKERSMGRAEFFVLFKKHKRFTFVINDRELLFTHTSSWPWTALQSKHIILANTSAKIRAAGELFFHQRGEVSELVVENNSGSYRPQVMNMQAVAQLLRHELGLDGQESDPHYAVKLHAVHYANADEKLRFEQEYAGELF